MWWRARQKQVESTEKRGFEKKNMVPEVRRGPGALGLKKQGKTLDRTKKKDYWAVSDS